jgi:SAM-dependent methyltransferase
MDDSRPIALDAYEALAESYARIAEAKAENGYIEHPCMRRQLGTVTGLAVLDAGCGPGILADYLLTQGAAVTGVDVSPRMLALADRRLGGRVPLHQADLARPMPFLPRGGFDVVASSLAIDYVRDWSIPMAEFHRVLKPRGRLVFTVQHPVGAFLWYKADRYAGVQYVEARWKGFGGDSVVMPDYYRSFAEMVNPLLAAGFALRQVVDAAPVEALKEKDPQLHEKYSRLPPFLCFDAVKV